MTIYQDPSNRYTDAPSTSAARLRQDLMRLTHPASAAPALPPQGNPSAINDGKGLGARATTAGIASPLTEDDADAREWHATPLYSTDGLLSWPQLKTLTLTDANGNTVVFEFDEAT